MRTRPRRTLRPRPPATLRAYQLTFPSPDDCHGAADAIVFARSARAARRKLPDTCDEYLPREDVKVRRRRVFDRYRRAGFVPPDVLMRHDWFFECGHCEHLVPCEHEADPDAPDAEDAYCGDGGPYVRGRHQVYCSERCYTRELHGHARADGELRGARFRVVELFPGVATYTRFLVRRMSDPGLFVRVSLCFHALDAPLHARDVLDVELRLPDASAPTAPASAVRRLHAWLCATELLGTEHPLCTGLAADFAALELPTALPPLTAPGPAPWVSPPGDTALELVEQYRLDADEIAGSLGWTRAHFDAFCAGTVVLTDDVAALLEELLGPPAAFWRERERQYRASLAAQRGRHALDRAFDASRARDSFPW